jgi:hypothetical protein
MPPVLVTNKLAGDGGIVLFIRVEREMERVDSYSKCALRYYAFQTDPPHYPSI